MSDLDSEDWLDNQFLEMDKSEKGWVSRSLGGMTKADALMGIPRKGQFLIEAPIGQVRELREIITESGTSQGLWLRQAVAMRLAAEGRAPEVYEQWMK